MVLTKTDISKVSSIDRWVNGSEKLYYAYQPIVNIHTGYTLGFEALLRGYKEAGFSSIDEVFKTAYEETVLYNLDLHLRELAITTLFEKKEFSSLKLFYNIDNRVLEMPDYHHGNTDLLVKSA
ncbi:MAG: EAL domain-containing protein, partial [Spirochaetales bacterium]|nr:EAL domain-containing protein [Spirochaetales bacterium]